MRFMFFSWLAFMPFFAIAEFAASAPYEMPRTHAHPIENKATGGHYTLYIKLPDTYHTKTEESDQALSDVKPLKHYPVIYTTDAVWHMDLLSGVTEFLLPDVILVGISWQHNMPTDIDYGERRAFASRFKDYSFVPHDKPDIQAKYQFGQGDKHLRFIQQDIIPYIEEHYRTLPDERAYLGYSMGAEFGGFMLLSAPNTFNYYLLGSPSLDTTSLSFLKALKYEASTQNLINTDVFVSIGELETTRMALTNEFVELLEHYKAQGVSVEQLSVISDSDHTSAVPDTFSQGIRWLGAKLTEKQ